MNRLIVLIAAVVIAALSGSHSLYAKPADQNQEWNFQVSLGKNNIGYHRFQLIHNGEQKQLLTEANFKVKLLFINLYKYQHRNTESWQGNCLTGIEAITNDNGKPYSVFGRQEGQQFVVSSGEARDALPSCIMSFAYWNPDFLNQPRLLNSQTGEYIDVTISEPVEEQLKVRGKAVPALRYQLIAKDMHIDLWYSSDDGQWLALESTTESGRKLRYQLI